MTDFCGEIVAVDRDLGTLTLEDRRGRRRGFPLGPGFLLEGLPVVLTPPVTRATPGTPRRTASGSVAVPGGRARVARESRIFVEGRHDAELVEKVWGDDLRVEGVVVEHLGGVDDLLLALRELALPRGGVSACSSITSSRARRRAGSPMTFSAPRWAATCWSSVIRSWTSGPPCDRIGSDFRPGPRSRGMWSGSTVSARRSAGRTRTR